MVNYLFKEVYDKCSLTSVPRGCPVYLPTNSSSLSEACGRCFFQMSMVKMVELLLKMEVSEDIRAAIITAIISPLKP